MSRPCRRTWKRRKSIVKRPVPGLKNVAWLWRRDVIAYGKPGRRCVSYSAELKAWKKMSLQKGMTLALFGQCSVAPNLALLAAPCG
jgi:hypothetical protein